MESTIYEFQPKAINGKEIPLYDFQGKVVLIVNVASQCGFTPQYQGLQKLYEKYKDKDFAILGFPCNQFGNQEPNSESEIKTFCERNFGVTFPLFAKIDVNGPQAHPLFRFLTKTKPGFLWSKRIKWNFTKFLIDKNGKPVKRYSPTVKPEAIEGDLQRLLK